MMIIAQTVHTAQAVPVGRERVYRSWLTAG